MRKRCVNCNKLSAKWQRVNGGPWHCYDGCYEATGRDYRTIDGHPAWESYGKKKAWAKDRMIPSYKFLAD